MTLLTVVNTFYRHKTLLRITLNWMAKHAVLPHSVRLQRSGRRSTIEHIKHTEGTKPTRACIGRVCDVYLQAIQLVGSRLLACYSLIYVNILEVVVVVWSP